MFMFRKWIFLGLMIMLGSVLAMLLIKGRNQENQAAAVPVEKVQTARSTPTRVMVPNDLQVVESSVQNTTVETGKSTSAQQDAHYQVVVRNRGQVAYHNLVLKLTCLGSTGKVLGTRSRLVPQTIQPGQTLIIKDLSIENLPPGTVRCDIRIVYSDIGT